MDPGSGFPGDLEEVFSGTAEASFLSRGSAGHPEFAGSSLGAQSSGSSGCDSGSHRRLLGSRPLVAEISRPSRQLCGLSPQLQDVDEASSASLPAFLHSLDRPSGQACSFESRDQGLVQGLGLPLSSSRRETVCPSSAFSGSHHRRLASRLGAVLHPHRVSGVWSKKEALDHINSLELKAVLLALQNLESHVLGRSVLIRSDNMTVVSFINHQGGTHSSSLCRLALDLWEWCLQRKIFLQAAHIPGEENIVADFLSRGKYLPSEWVLNPSVFQKICLASSPPPEIDLFASALNFRLPKYCSRCPDAQAWRIDALSFPWTDLRLYAFPPFSLLPRILDKVAQDEADLLLVAPYWPQRPWFPRLLRLLVGLPRVLPVLKDLVVQPLSLTPHPRVESLHLSLWPLSGSRVRMQAFLKELRSSQRNHSDSPLATLMIPDWTLSGSGVPRSLAIPLLPL